MKSIVKIAVHILRLLILMAIGGVVYIGIELLWRGHSHWTMGIVGGLCFVLIGLLNEMYTFKMYMETQALISAGMVTIVEFLSGYIINIKCGLGVWDYSNLPLNIMGQVCLLFSILWFFLSFVAIYLDDVLRNVLFGEPIDLYRWKFKNVVNKIR